MRRALRRPAQQRSRAPAITLTVDEPRWRKDPAVLPLIRRAVRLALTSCSPPSAFPSSDSPVTVLLTNDKNVQMLNADFRGKDKPTNVLSFPSAEHGFYLGDIAMAYGVVAREARLQRKTIAEHAAHLAVHGVLHLIGYDHEKASDARKMEALEIRLLAGLGIGDPYTPRPYTRNRKAA